MSPDESRRLWALANRQLKESNRLSRKAVRECERAGHSIGNGTGDEGWRRNIEDYACSKTLKGSALELINLLLALKKKRSK